MITLTCCFEKSKKVECPNPHHQTCNTVNSLNERVGLKLFVPHLHLYNNYRYYHCCWQEINDVPNQGLCEIVFSISYHLGQLMQ